MNVLTQVAEKGVVERSFELEINERPVPGIIWLPEDSSGPRPTILIGHGGTQHKRVPNVLGLARRFVRHLGYAAIAIDAPGHGDRVRNHEASDAARAQLQARIASGGSGSSTLELTPDQVASWAKLTTRGVAEWKTIVDLVEAGAFDGLTAGPIGYWGVSMGTVIGLPFVASEPRIRAAVLGLAGVRDRAGGAAFDEAARSLTIPIMFLFQWDDELMSRESGLALFDAIGSKEKTMHVNPGSHVGTPLFERDAADLFFERHLGSGSPSHGR